MQKISIITPSYNQGQYLEQTIDAVLAQQYPNLEYIIIDGGSTDNSVEIIKKYEKHLKYWVSEKDSGQSEAINKGLKIATGEIINWINSDDWYNPGTLQRVSEYFNDGQVMVVSGKGNVWLDGTLKSHNPGVDLYPSFEKTVGWARIDQPETFFRREAVLRMGPLNTELHYIMDREWWIRYLLLFGQENVLKVDDELVNFRLHADSKTYNRQALFEQEANNVYYTIAKQNQLEETAVFENYFSVTPIDSLNYTESSDKKILKKIIHYFWLQQARLNYAANNLAEAKKYLQITDKHLLEATDAAELDHLKIRATLIPVWLKKLMNKRS